MCGIVGGINISPSEQLLDSIAHRGPDDRGLYEYNNVFLGHTRLSILDLSEAGHQPMFSEDGDIVIIFNGEIYNHLDLRRELPSTIRFKSTSDTETILYGYMHWGIQVLNKLNGIFAFAILDKKKNKLLLARDHFGVKPFYYYHSGNQLIFGSEIKSFTKIPAFDKTLNYRAIVNYINFLWCPGEMTPFAKTHKLLPGHFIEIDLARTQLSLNPVKFYDVPMNGDYQWTNEQEAMAMLEQKLVKAVERQLLADVPLGFFLSGGLDSSAIVAIAAKHISNKDIQCYTIDTGEGDYEGFANDLPYAHKVAKHLGVKLHTIQAKPDIVKDFDKVIYHLDEPQADAAPINVLNICAAARAQGIKVLLGGTAGDDIFSGYRSHQALYYEKYFKYIPTFVGAGIKGALAASKVSSPTVRRLRKLTSNLDKSLEDRMYGYAEWISLSTNKGLFSAEVYPSIADFEPKDYYFNLLGNIPKEKSPLNQKLYWELKGFLPDHNLNYTDKLSMAVGVETRVPFLDVELVDFSTKIHPDLKMKGTTTKYLLKKLMEKYLPHDIIYRPKTGFGAPVRDWICKDLREKVQDELSVDAIKRRGIFNPNAVTKLIADNQSGSIDASYTIWSLLAIESWMRQFVDE